MTDPIDAFRCQLDLVEAEHKKLNLVAVALFARKASGEDVENELRALSDRMRQIETLVFQIGRNVDNAAEDGSLALLDDSTAAN